MRSVIALIIAQLSANVFGGTVFRSDYTYYEEVSGWMSLHAIPATWSDAHLRCILEGATLASPLDPKLRAVLRRVAGKKTIFIGISATYSKGDYYSAEGTPLSKMDLKWKDNEPNYNENSQGCLIMSPIGEVSDASCYSQYPYVCYKRNTTLIPKPSICGTVDEEYYYYRRTGQCYKFHRFGQTWPRAFMTCAAEGAHLAIINSDLEAQVLKEFLEKNPIDTVMNTKFKKTVLIGFRDVSQHGLWLTIHDERLEDTGYAVWEKEQPDNWTGEDDAGEACGSMYRNAKLNDISCNVPVAFICEKTPEKVIEKVASSKLEPRNDNLNLNLVEEE